MTKRKRAKGVTTAPAPPKPMALRELRLSAGLTQTTTAARMGVTQRRVSAVESTPVPALELRTLIAFVDALGGAVSVVVDLEAASDGSASRAVLDISPP